ncbi:short-chain dehydrogenase [Jeotgalibacillus salarius]|uniref:Short-chain dehydrogenase n=1 Tax=Jeotgalibacillus salarius TaxID=546023 RepID=A0A4Y8LJW7_9BACL|nr:short-chain dehydrogenase [Jeotgalibacillus salarius]TFE02875.1 short-chain dehydrogenase [Jeotgalibacillus salarius]
MENTNKQNKVDKLIKFTPLYKTINIDSDNYQFIFSFLNENFSNQFDSYCIHCKNESTFKKVTDESYTYNLQLKKITAQDLSIFYGFHLIEYKCSRNETHSYSFSYRFQDLELTKIGQFPSIADIATQTIQKYRKVLKKDYNDFSRAIGLYSHGVGAGSFVYLRRIFENLIEETKEKFSSTQSDWNDDKYQKSRMDEKIDILKSDLPEFLVKNRILYGILSKGIHELSEEKCIELFPHVKLAIELILDEKLANIERESKIKNLSEIMSSTATEL